MGFLLFAASLDSEALHLPDAFRKQKIACWLLASFAAAFVEMLSSELQAE